MKEIFIAIKSINRSVVAMLVLALAFTACEFEDPWSPYKSKAEIDGTLITYHATTLSGVTIGDPSLTWTLTVIEGNSFCTAASRAGFVGQQFALRFSANNSDEDRYARAVITFSDGYSKAFIIRQLIKSANPDYDRPWAEQPDYMPNANYIHKTYYTTLNDKRRVRNYSVCYDTQKGCSRWVAYPAHSSYMAPRNYQVGSDTPGRTNAWAYDDAVTQYKESSNWNTAFEILSTYVKSLDTYNTYTYPIIPQSKQANISKNIGGGYARGHMLPSADRYNTWNTNAQTCYSTNIMAQDYDFNSGSWGTLENKVRGKIPSDTLFVVVGTLFESNKTVSNSNRQVAVPSHCYKLLLRTKTGYTGKHIADITSADELMCIGFIFENDESATYQSLSSAAVSVAEIERRSGFTFFRNLNPKIADKVKAQCNYSEWKF